MDATDDTAALSALWTDFQVTALGDGDPIVGANTLAAMALVLADVAPADGSLFTEEGAPVRFGTSLLVTGAASCGRVGDGVLEEVRRTQDNLGSHLRRYVDNLERLEGNRMRVGDPPPAGGDSGWSIEQLGGLQSDDQGLCGEGDTRWFPLMAESLRESVRDLAARPKFLVTATGPETLAGQMTGLRPGAPLAHLGVRLPSDFAGYAVVGSALIEGRCPLGNGYETVRGNVLLTDPMEMLGEAAKAPDHGMAWLGHLLWLTDGRAGPEPPADGAATATRTGWTIPDRFRRALYENLARRLNGHGKRRRKVERVPDAGRFRWTAFLREMEPHLSGISGAARNLLDSLVYGLGEISRADSRHPLGLRATEAFARFLVRRMVNARTAMLHEGAMAQRRVHIERVYRKLGDGPVDSRTLYRNLSLRAADCEEILQWLESGKLVRRAGRMCELLDGARLDFDNHFPVLEA